MAVRFTASAVLRGCGAHIKPASHGPSPLQPLPCGGRFMQRSVGGSGSVGAVTTAARGLLQVRRVKTESMTDLELGTAAPDFSLVEPLTGKVWSLADFQGCKALLVMVISNHCPFVKMLKESFTQLAAEYEPRGVRVVALSPNSVRTHPQDGPDAMAEDARQYAYPFPYLYDETQAVAQAYRAACTPEFYVFAGSEGGGLALAYHGQWDDARPNGSVPVTGKDVRAALDAVLAGEPVPAARPSIGCNIKWHPEQEPAYFGATSVK